MENKNFGMLYSWPVIFLAFCCFWPVGLYLIVKRISMDKRTAMNAGKLLGIFGAISYGMAAIGFLASVTGSFDGSDVVMIVFFAAAGFVLRKVSKGIKKDAEKVKEYLSVIVNGNTKQLDAIAAATGKSYDEVHADIKKMIDKGFLKDAYINENTREIVGVGNGAPTVATKEGASAAVKDAVPQVKVVACPCCGANNTISGSLGECEYCGSPLK